jgi:hypothetical protein
MTLKLFSKLLKTFIPQGVFPHPARRKSWLKKRRRNG